MTNKLTLLLLLLLSTTTMAQATADPDRKWLINKDFMFHSNQDAIWFKNTLANKPLVEKLLQIKLIIFDVDGTLTDAGIYVDETGEGGRVFSVQDGYAFRPAIAAGLTIALISGKANQSTITRGNMIGVAEAFCIVGSKTKPTVIKKMQADYGFLPNQTLIMGDDHLDAVVKQDGCVALFACPNNAPFYYQGYADLVLPRAGGDQAARLLLDLLLYLHKKHFDQALIDHALGL
jgi:3-deoxy-D-manno-octulosonate 8-phosphate phosphatase (KDO 8-P phosphatase)